MAAFTALKIKCIVLPHFPANRNFLTSKLNVTTPLQYLDKYLDTFGYLCIFGLIWGNEELANREEVKHLVD